jgi:hypothetical protein
LFSSKADLNLQAFLHQEKPFTGFLYPFNAFFKDCPACRELQSVLLCDRKYDKKEGANDCHYSYNQAPQGPSSENKTMSTPLYSKGRFHHLTSDFEFCGFDCKAKKALCHFRIEKYDTKIIFQFIATMFSSYFYF